MPWEVPSQCVIIYYTINHSSLDFNLTKVRKTVKSHNRYFKAGPEISIQLGAHYYIYLYSIRMQEKVQRLILYTL